MVWYYAEGDRQRGPISDQEFQELIDHGRVTRETLIWQDGMAEWQPLKEIKTDGLANVSPSVSSVTTELGTEHATPAGEYVPVTPPAAGVSAVPQTFCTQCGRGPLRGGEGVQLGNIVLCTACDEEMARYYTQQGLPAAQSPSFLQRAGAAVGQLVFASIFSRAVAKFIDGFVENVLMAIVLAATVDMSALGLSVQDLLNEPEKFVNALRPYFLAGLVFTVVYEAVLVGAFSATLGKLSLGIRVVSGTGERVSWNQAIIRAIAPAVLQVPMLLMPMSIWANIAQFIFLFGYVIAVMDPERRTLYDHLANTRVVQ